MAVGLRARQQALPVGRGDGLQAIRQRIQRVRQAAPIGANEVGGESPTVGPEDLHLGRMPLVQLRLDDPHHLQDAGGKRRRAAVESQQRRDRRELRPRHQHDGEPVRQRHQPRVTEAGGGRHAGRCAEIGEAESRLHRQVVAARHAHHAGRRPLRLRHRSKKQLVGAVRRQQPGGARAQFVRVERRRSSPGRGRRPRRRPSPGRRASAPARGR